MTTPRYPSGCPAMSQVPGENPAWSASAAWCVNFNNGNFNNNHRDNNNGLALAVRRAGEFQGDIMEEITLRGLHAAWQAARRRKVPSHNQRHFEDCWIDNLIQIHGDITAHRWSPRPSKCFIATRPKAREIHAPDFGDRVVHHWLVPQLERIYEPGFIHDSYANRCGKGTHAAVRRLQQYVRQVRSGQPDGWYLQLDIHNFFNSIHRPTLWSMLKPRLQRADLGACAQHVAHALLRNPPLQAGVTVRATPAQLAQVPPHKQLVNAAPGHGLPIGNLSSQFFANVYLDALDQFAKHTLRARRYLRYVDDFVIVHHCRDTLADWQQRIVAFLADRLRLRLKPETRLARLGDGIDFLGYVVRPTHTLVRPRVVTHASEALRAWEAQHVVNGRPHPTAAALAQVRATLASYRGHFKHANTHRLQQRLHARFPWIQEIEA